MAYTKYDDGYFVRAFPAVDENVEYDWIDKQRIGADPAVGDIKLGARHFNRKKVLDTDGLDIISITEPAAGYPSNFREKLLWLIARWLNEHYYDKNNNNLRVKNAAGVILTTQVTSEVANVEKVEKAT